MALLASSTVTLASAGRPLRRLPTTFSDRGEIPTADSDYETIEYSHERECLQFGTGHRGFHVVKPRRLILERIEETPAESFLLLELAELRRAMPDEEVANGNGRDEDERVRVHRRDHELLVEIDGQYFDYSMWAEGHMGHDEYGDEIPFPEDTRIISRWLRGRILFVCKGSLWNGTPATYDGRHNQMSSTSTRSLIERSRAHGRSMKQLVLPRSSFGSASA